MDLTSELDDSVEHDPAEGFRCGAVGVPGEPGVGGAAVLDDGDQPVPIHRNIAGNFTGAEIVEHGDGAGRHA